MPTAAKLVAGILFAALGYYASEIYKLLMDEGAYAGRLSEINAMVGLVAGWRVAGSRANDNYSAAISYGLSAGFMMVLMSLFVHSVTEMVNRSYRKIYDGATEAVVAVFELMFDYASVMVDANLIVTLVVGSIIASLIIEWVGQRFP